MIDAESLAVYGTAIMMLLCYGFLRRSQIFPLLTQLFPYLIGATVLDAILHYMRYNFFFLPTFWVNIDFLSYYTYMALLTLLIWYETERIQVVETERNLILIILSFGLYLTMAIMYILSQEQLFFELSLLLFAFHGVFATLATGINSMNLHTKTDHHKWLPVVFGGIIWFFGYLLYPAFLFSQFVFFAALSIFYMGLILTLFSLIGLASAVSDLNTPIPA